MKRFFSVAFAVMMVAGFAACKKDYTCECTTTDSTGAVVSTSSSTFNATKKQAKSSCDGLQVSSGGLTVTCELK